MALEGKFGHPMSTTVNLNTVKNQGMGGAYSKKVTTGLDFGKTTSSMVRARNLREMERLKRKESLRTIS